MCCVCEAMDNSSVCFMSVQFSLEALQLGERERKELYAPRPRALNAHRRITIHQMTEYSEGRGGGDAIVSAAAVELKQLEHTTLGG